MDNGKTASRQAARKRRLLINRDFTLLWSAQAISKLGDVVFDHTLVFWIATSIAREQRWAPLAVSGIFVATALPTLGVGPIGGVFVDRWPKRSTMLLMDALRAMLLLLLLLVTSILPPPFQLPPFGQLGAIYLVVFLATICAQFFDPSRLALVGDLVSEPDRAHATGLLEVTRNLAVVLGPPVAALLFAQRSGVTRAFWLSILVLSGLLLIYARQTSFAPAVVVSFLLGIPYAAIGVASDPLLLHVTPRALIGRIFSVIITIVTLSILVSTTLVGYLASMVLHDFHARFLGLAFGPIDTIFTVGSLFGLLAGMYAMVNLWGLHLAREEDGPVFGPPRT